MLDQKIGVKIVIFSMIQDNLKLLFMDLGKWFKC